MLACRLIIIITINLFLEPIIINQIDPNNIVHHSTQIVLDDFNSLAIRISNVKVFFKKNSTVKIAHIANRFWLNHVTLYSSIAKDKKLVSQAKQRGGQNKILEEY